MTQTAEATQEENKLKYQANIKDVGPCKKKIEVTIPVAEVTKFRARILAEYTLKAEVPGFRVGFVPKTIVERRFKDEILDRTKRNLLLESLDLISKDQNIEPLGEPELDIDAINIPDNKDFEYEFSIEVRPQITIPDFSKMEIEMYDSTFDKQDLDRYKRYLQYSYCEFDKVEGAAQYHDKIVASFIFTHNGKTLLELKSRNFRVCEKISFEDTEINGFDKLVVGKKVGDNVETEVTISSESTVVELRGEVVQVKITIHEILRIAQSGDFSSLAKTLQQESEEKLDAWLTLINLRQSEYQSRQFARQQLMDKIAEAANWDLPESLVSRQVDNAMRREYLELAQSGYSQDEINSTLNYKRRNVITTTRNNLKQHFILDMVATQHNITASPDEIELEINLMAENQNENPRKLRSRLVKNGMIENLEAQLRERKTIDYILGQVSQKKVPGPEKDGDTTFAVRSRVASPTPFTNHANENDDAGYECDDENSGHDHDHDH